MTKRKIRESGTASQHDEGDNTERVASRSTDSRFGEDRHRNHASDESSKKNLTHMLKVPRTNTSRRKVAPNGKVCTGNRRTVRDVFNESYFELYEDPERDGETLSDSDARLINKNISTIIYDVKRFQSGTQTFTLLGRKCLNI